MKVILISIVAITLDCVVAPQQASADAAEDERVAAVEAEASSPQARDRDKAVAAKARADAGPARPQLIAVRGGSLGLPISHDNEGVQAGIDAKLDASGDSKLSSSSSADAFAKVGVLHVGNQLSVDILGESYQADLPRVVLTGAPAVPTMFTTNLISVGLRARFNFSPTLWATTKLTAACTAATTRMVETKSIDTSCTQADKAALTRKSEFSISGGLRLIRRGGSDEATTALQGAQWEVAVRRDSEGEPLSHSVFFGLSGSHFNQSDDVADGVTTRFMRTNEVRVSAGLELRSPVTADQTVIPAVGLYGVASHDYWTNTFHMDRDEKIRGWQVEGGLYVSGVMNGFSGLLELSVLRPYGHDDAYQFIISVIPFGGGVPATSKGK